MHNYSSECSMNVQHIQPLSMILNFKLRSLEKELEKHSKEHEADLANIIQDKVKEERRAIQAEEILKNKMDECKHDRTTLAWTKRSFFITFSISLCKRGSGDGDTRKM